MHFRRSYSRVYFHQRSKRFHGRVGIALQAFASSRVRDSIENITRSSAANIADFESENKFRFRD